MLQFFELLTGYMSDTLYPCCTLHPTDDHSPKDSPNVWPVVRSGGRVGTDCPHGTVRAQMLGCPYGAVLAQMIGSGPLGVMSTWEIRRFGAVSGTCSFGDTLRTVSDSVPAAA